MGERSRGGEGGALCRGQGARVGEQDEPPQAGVLLAIFQNQVLSTM